MVNISILLMKAEAQLSNLLRIQKNNDMNIFLTISQLYSSFNIYIYIVNIFISTFSRKYIFICLHCCKNRWLLIQ